MNRSLAFRLGAVALVALLLIGCQPSASASPSGESSPSAAPSITEASTSTDPTALSEAFTSERHGFSISYPAGWVTRTATEAWTTGYPDYYTPAGDVISHPTLQDHLWVAIASQPRAGKSGEEWVDATLAGVIAQDDCGLPREVVTVDGARGEICGPSVVAISSGDRGYLIWLGVSSDDPSIAVTYDRAWFDEVLATVQLRPEDAAD